MKKSIEFLLLPNMMNSGCFKKGNIPWNKGLRPTKQKDKEELNKYQRLYRFKNRFKKREYYKKYHLLNKVKRNDYMRKCRVENGERYNLLTSIWRKRNKYLVRAYIHNRRNLIKKTGFLTKKIIQMVYEDNIKQYGTLTCYLCLKPIEFGKDNLEHKIPLCRGGTNEYNNLGIAHQKCNLKKYTKTYSEWNANINSGAGTTEGSESSRLLEE